MEPDEEIQVNIYDDKHGRYRDDIHNLPEDTKLPSGSLPKAPDPRPFRVGEPAPGTRNP